MLPYGFSLDAWRNIYMCTGAKCAQAFSGFTECYRCNALKFCIYLDDILK